MIVLLDKKVKTLGCHALQGQFLKPRSQGTRKTAPQGKSTQQNNEGGPTNPIEIEKDAKQGDHGKPQTKSKDTNKILKISTRL